MPGKQGSARGNYAHKGAGPRSGCKFTPEQRAFIGRVISRLQCKPVYMQLKVCADIWGISDHWAMQMRNGARGI